jgi:hypothetical protein
MKDLGADSMFPLIQRAMMIDACPTATIFLAQLWITSAKLDTCHRDIYTLAMYQLNN